MRYHRPDAIGEMTAHLRATDASVSVHEVTFIRNKRTGLYAAKCSTCGWMTVGSEDEVHALAGSHDLDWEVV